LRAIWFDPVTQKTVDIHTHTHTHTHTLLLSHPPLPWHRYSFLSLSDWSRHGNIVPSTSRSCGCGTSEVAERSSLSLIHTHTHSHHMLISYQDKRCRWNIMWIWLWIIRGRSVQSELRAFCRGSTQMH